MFCAVLHHPSAEGLAETTSASDKEVCLVCAENLLGVNWCDLDGYFGVLGEVQDSWVSDCLCRASNLSERDDLWGLRSVHEVGGDEVSLEKFIVEAVGHFVDTGAGFLAEEVVDLSVDALIVALESSNARWLIKTGEVQDHVDLGRENVAQDTLWSVGVDVNSL